MRKTAGPRPGRRRSAGPSARSSSSSSPRRSPTATTSRSASASTSATGAVKTFFPPYTIGNTGSVWYAPYDLAIGILAIHSHKRTVKGTIDVMPANPIRTGGLSQEEAGAGTRPQECGVSQNGLPPEHIYADWHWDDPPVCRYYKQPDGPLILRKGDALVTHCIHNNGVI